MEKEKQSAEYRSRTTRLAKWRELAQQAQKDLEIGESAPQRIMILGLQSYPFLSCNMLNGFT